MKRLHFILFLFPFISFCQTDNEFKLQNVFQINENKHCISKMDCFYFENTIDEFGESDEFYEIFYYSYGEKTKQVIDSVDDTSLLYGSDLCCFQNETENSYVVFWKIGGEFAPSFYVYYLKNGNLIKIGEWNIIEIYPIEYSEYLDYSIENIRIFKKDDEIEFSFLKDVDFMVITEDYDYDNWGTFKAGELVISFNIADGTVKRGER